MQIEFIFKDKNGKILTPDDIYNMAAEEMIRAYSTAKKKLIRIGTYSQSDLITKFW